MKKIGGLQVYNSGFIGNDQDPEDYKVEPLMINDYPDKKDKTKDPLIIPKDSNKGQEVEPLIPIISNY